MSKMSVKVRSAYDDDYNSDAHATHFPCPSVTKQSFKDECDINTLVSRWQKSGQVGSSFNATPGDFRDVSNVPDYHTALNMVIEAQRMFDALPSNVRDRFQNDPGAFLSFMDDPRNVDEAVSLGLAVKREVGAELPPAPSAATTSQAPEAPSTAGSKSSPAGG